MPKRASPLSILAIFAHPDDEIGIGSSLVHYAKEGVITSLVCASRGEAATIYCDDCATRENLAEVRTRELECACRHLGVTELRWLDWPDGGIRNLRRMEAIGAIVGIIRQLQPDVVLTHPEHGLYPHPDHLSIWEIVRAAFEAAADPAQYPNRGPAWAPARLFTRAIPQSFFDAAPAFAQYRVQLNGEQLPFFATPDADVDVVMEVACCVGQRMEAWDCHRSQHNPEGAFSQMPEEVRQSLWANEHYVLEAARVPLPEGERHDLFAGLVGRSAEPLSVEDEAAAFHASIATQRAFMQVEQEYGTSTKDDKFKQLLSQLPEQNQEFLHLMARGLRRAGGAPAEIAVDPHVVAQGLACRGVRARARFLLAGARHAVLYFGEMLDDAEPEVREIWDELISLAQARHDLIAAFARGV